MKKDVSVAPDIYGLLSYVTPHHNGAQCQKRAGFWILPVAYSCQWNNNIGDRVDLQTGEGGTCSRQIRLQRYFRAIDPVEPMRQKAVPNIRYESQQGKSLRLSHVGRNAGVARKTSNSPGCRVLNRLKHGCIQGVFPGSTPRKWISS